MNRDWVASAECAKYGAPDMFPQDTDFETIDEAKATCRACPVKVVCLAWALESGERFGIWGGTTPAERVAVRRNEVRRNNRRAAKQAASELQARTTETVALDEAESLL